MSDELESTNETEEMAGIETEAVAEELVAAGRQKLRQAMQWGISAGVGIVAVLVTNFVMAAVESRMPVEITGAPTPAAVSGIQPAPADIHRPAVQVVEVQAQETEADRRIMEILGRLTTAIDNLAAEVDVSSGSQVVQAVGSELQPAHTVFEAAAPTSTPEPVLSIWEDGGGCWTPSDMPVLHLCGASAGDGYVIRWAGVPGDNRGPEIPDTDWLAVQGGGDRLVWSGAHPATGEVVSVTYWSAGHVLAVHAAGRMLFRIDRNHAVQR